MNSDYCVVDWHQLAMRQVDNDDKSPIAAWNPSHIKDIKEYESKQLLEK